LQKQNVPDKVNSLQIKSQAANKGNLKGKRREVIGIGKRPS
jgi:hypothetical protein